MCAHTHMRPWKKYLENLPYLLIYDVIRKREGNIIVKFFVILIYTRADIITKIIFLLKNMFNILCLKDREKRDEERRDIVFSFLPSFLTVDKSFTVKSCKKN